MQTMIENGQQEAFGFAGAGAGGEEGMSPGFDRAQRKFLMLVQRIVMEDALECGMKPKGLIGNERVDAGALLKRLIEVDVRAAIEQRQPIGAVAERILDLRGHVRIGDGERGEQVAPELIDDGLAELNGVEGHSSQSRKSQSTL